MSTCSVPANQSIYKALLDKAASYPADKPYQAKAYKKVAESVLTAERNLYDVVNEFSPLHDELDSAGDKITEFIYDFIKANPKPVTTTYTPTEPITSANWSVQATEAARKIAAMNAPTTTISDILRRGPLETPYSPPVATSTPVYTANNPRRSRRNLGKTVKYYADEDDQDDIEEALIAFCNKKGLTYSDELLNEFNKYIKTAPDYFGKTYNWSTNKYKEVSIIEKATLWAKYYSTSLQAQIKDVKIRNTIAMYCTKNNIQFDPIMTKKYNDWVADPANYKLTYKTYTSYNCTCSSCSANNKTTNTSDTYTYPLTTSVRIKNFFSSFKKTIVF
jgi:hypothetical protein